MHQKKAFERQIYAEQPFLLGPDEILFHLQSNAESGLRSSQVEQYQQKYGPNKLRGQEGVSWYSILLKQIANAMILVSR